MAGTGVTSGIAFALLRRRSQHTNTKLCDVARAVMEELTGPSTEPGPVDP